MEDKIVLNKWVGDLCCWILAQFYYYFRDSEAERWCIYLRWDGMRGDEPWDAELYHCDKDWEWDDDKPVKILKEKNHVPGIVTGYYYRDEYPSLMVKALELMRERFPGLEFPNNQ